MIDLYDTPIDLRPIPEQGPEEIRIETISECIEYLRQHGDHYGVQLLNGRDKENSGQPESPPAQAG